MVEQTNTPTPDPTILTTDALRREIKASTELTDAKLEAQSNAHEAEKLHVEQINTLRDKLAAAESRSVDTQFALRDMAADKLAVADKTAIAAALQAQKEQAALTNNFMTLLVDKMDASFTKSVDAITKLIASNTETVTAIINDLKDRQSRGEARGGGMKESWAILVAAVMAVLAIISVVIAANAMSGGAS